MKYSSVSNAETDFFEYSEGNRNNRSSNRVCLYGNFISYKERRIKSRVGDTVIQNVSQLLKDVVESKASREIVEKIEQQYMSNCMNMNCMSWIVINTLVVDTRAGDRRE